MSESSDDERNEKLKFIILGASGTGKSSICNRYGHDTFKEQYDPTLGVDFFMKRISLKEDIHVTLQVWDLSGMAGGGNMLDKYLYGCHAIMLVYDVTDARSFSNLPTWLSAISEARDPKQNPPKVMLLGNKIDLGHLRLVKNEEHLTFAKRNCILQDLVSAKTGESVSKCFRKLASSALGIRASSQEEEGLDPVTSKGSEVSGSGDVPLPQKDLPLKIPQSSTKPSAMCSLS